MVKKININSEEKQSLKDKVCDWLFCTKMYEILEHVYRFIKRLPKYIKLAWTQENWDYEYLYDLIEMKLKEFIEAQEKDDIHDKKEVNRCIKQLNICLARLDRYRNWTKYYDYPMEDMKWQTTDNGLRERVSDNPENEKQRRGAHQFIEKNYDRFWKDFLRWHKNWWT